MSSTERFADSSPPRLRGDMYLRAERRHREELAGAQPAGIPTPAATSAYEAPPEDGRVSDRPEAILAPVPVGSGTEVVVVAPARTAVVAARPVVDLSAAVTLDPPPAPPAGAEASAAQAFAPPHPPVAPAPRPIRSPNRRQHTLIPAAALGGLAIVGTLGLALTLFTGGDAGDAGAASEVAQATTRERPASASAPAGVAASASASGASAAAPPRASAPERVPVPAPVPVPVAATTPPANMAKAAPAPRPAARPVRAAAPRTQARATGAAAAAVGGQIRITSTPPGARVTVDGIGRGQTPLTVGNLALGSRTVRITQDGYASHQTVVQLSGENPSRTVSVPLRRR